MTKKLHTVVIGNGSIARFVVEKIMPLDTIVIDAIICRERSVEKAQALTNNKVPVHTSIEQLAHKPELLVDCAGHAGLAQHAPVALSRGIDVISISTGALSDPALLETLEAHARSGSASIEFLSGAVGGIDALTSARIGEIDSVTYTGRKPPSGWAGSPAEEKCNLTNLDTAFTHFCGTAREAARLYPKNANVAATVAMASIGLDNVMVNLIADPDVCKNIHEITASGTFGKLGIQVEGNPLASNPKSSALAAMSIISAIKKRSCHVRL